MLESNTVKQPLNDVTFAFLDTETTGLSPRHGARVCELAILFVKDGKKVSEFTTLINPQGPIDPGAQRIHGISTDMVKDSPTFDKIAPRVYELLEGTTMVCHNAPFDVSFMKAEFESAGMEMPETSVLDTLRLARKHFKFPKNNLSTIAEALGVQTTGWHRAGNDVRILRGIFDHFLKDFDKKGVETLEDLLKL
jgi:DNA polymerase-3 subunit epsilon